LGTVLGVLLAFVLAEILKTEFFFNFLFYRQTNLPASFYSPKNGSIFSVGVIMTILLGLSGSVLGFVIYKVI
jgi:heme/copper-type cytochrome/quinol oxidase subunit 3